MDAGESTHPDKAAKFEYQIKLGGLFFDHFVGKCVKALSGQAPTIYKRRLVYWRLTALIDATFTSCGMGTLLNLNRQAVGTIFLPDF